MREIKFRARHKETGEWYYSSSLITDINQGDEYNLTLSLFWLQVEKGWLDIKTVGQYTGLKDKNGKEIYKGDIVQMAGKVRQPRWEVAWYENGWQMKLVWIKGRLPECYYVKLSSDKVIEFDEVIDNIYENEDLLK